MFGVLVMYQVIGEVDRANVVAEDDDSLVDGDMQWSS
jgi:hypothetical protein